MESNIRQRICSQTCVGCPLRTAAPQTQERALSVFRQSELSPVETGFTYAELGQAALLDGRTLFAAERENSNMLAGRQRKNNLAKCARRILNDECDAYMTDTGEVHERIKGFYDYDPSQEDHLRYSPGY